MFYIAAGLLFWVLADKGRLRWPICSGVALALCGIAVLPPLSLLFLTRIAVFRRVSLQEPLILTGLALGAAVAVMAFREFPLQAGVGAASAGMVLGTSGLVLRGAVWRLLMRVGGGILFSLPGASSHRWTGGEPLWPVCSGHSGRWAYCFTFGAGSQSGLSSPVLAVCRRAGADPFRTDQQSHGAEVRQQDVIRSAKSCLAKLTAAGARNDGT